MNRAEIRQTFRDDNPDMPARVVSDTTLNAWCKLANKEICAETWCIVTNESESFTSEVGVWYYDLATKIDKFYEIDDFPGGGVYYDNDPMRKLTPGRMNTIDRTWKLRGNGRPTRYWRRGRFVWFDRPNEAGKTIEVDAVLVPDPFDSDTKSPYNSLTHLEPFHEAVVRYLTWRAKAGKAGKDQEAAIARSLYQAYVVQMKKKVRGYQQGHAQMRNRARI